MKWFGYSKKSLAATNEGMVVFIENAIRLLQCAFYKILAFLCNLIYTGLMRNTQQCGQLSKRY